MRKLFFLSFAFISSVCWSQTSMSFYHFGDLATFQNSSLNPAHTPDARFFFGLPGLSGVHIHYNNKLSYNQMTRTDTENGDTYIDLAGAISDMQRNNLLSGIGGVEIFHFGYSVPDGPVFTIFAKERFEGDFLFPKKLAEFLFEGNGPHLGEEIDVGAMGVSVTHFREIGAGMAYQVNRQLRVGGRFKILQGFSNLSTPGNLKATLEVNPQTFAWDLQTENVAFRQAGFNSYEDGSYLISPGNGGMAVDVGFDFMVNRYLGFSGSLVDLGWINWNSDITSRVYQDESFNYSGIDIKGIENITEALQDSLFDRFTTVTNSDKYRTWLPTTAYGSIIWRYTDNTIFLGSVGARYIQGQMKMLYGGGVKQRIGPLTATLNAIKMPQQFFNIGAGLMVRAGPVQYYLAVDQIVNFSVPDMKAFDVRTGMNFVFGRRATPGLQSRGAGTSFAKNKGSGASNKGISTGSFLGEKVKTKRREGIYSIIKRQKKRDVPASIRPPKIRGRKSKVRSAAPPKNQKLPRRKSP